VIRALHEIGWHFPDDVSVIGFNNIEDSRFSTPSLTTMVPYNKKTGELAVTFLLGRIDDGTDCIPVSLSELRCHFA
jgi:DNA-binding LacI/PurR family transcriptional regulator